MCPRKRHPKGRDGPQGTIESPEGLRDGVEVLSVNANAWRNTFETILSRLLRTCCLQNYTRFVWDEIQLCIAYKKRVFARLIL